MSLPESCPVCNSALLKTPTSTYLDFTCSCGCFDFQSDVGETIDEYSQKIIYKKINYTMHSGKAYKEKTNIQPAFTYIINDIGGIIVFENDNYTPFYKRIEFFNKIMKIGVFL